MTSTSLRCCASSTPTGNCSGGGTSSSGMPATGSRRRRASATAGRTRCRVARPARIACTGTWTRWPSSPRRCCREVRRPSNSRRPAPRPSPFSPQRPPRSDLRPQPRLHRPVPADGLRPGRDGARQGSARAHRRRHQVVESGSQLRLTVFHGQLTQTYYETQVELVETGAASTSAPRS